MENITETMDLTFVLIKPNMVFLITDGLLKEFLFLKKKITGINKMIFANRSAFKKLYFSPKRHKITSNVFENKIEFRIKTNNRMFPFVLHRKIGPAQIYVDKKIYIWVRLGKPHRIDGPFRIEDNINRNYYWALNGVMTSEIYFWNK